MEFLEALRIVEGGFSDSTRLSLPDLLRFNEATAIIAREYIRVKDRIAPYAGSH